MTRISVSDSSPRAWVLPRRCQGFTLLELLLVLGILAMAAVLVVPGLTTLDAPSFNAQVRELSGMFNYARRTAVVQGRPVQVEVWGSVPDADDTAHRTAGVGRWVGSDIAMQYADSTQRWRSIEDPEIVEFYPEGGSTGGELRLQQGSRVVILTIDPFSGRLSRREPDR